MKPRKPKQENRLRPIPNVSQLELEGNERTFVSALYPYRDYREVDREMELLQRRMH
jgi:hypothetical protein